MRASGVSAATIARRFYDTEYAKVPAEATVVEQHLRAMRDELVWLALLDGSAALAEHLKASCAGTAR